ncbi:MAG: hypothetical protein ABSG89_05670 [Bacteroidales bacterium]|jgi:hypothetical protein
MKKISLIFLTIFAAAGALRAQNVDDALRYSDLFYTGTARFMSMGGAFTALGGDISTLSQNPAGIGVFRSSEVTVSPQLFHFSSSATYNNTTADDYIYNFNLGQIGFVTTLKKNNSGSGLVTFNFGYSFNKTNNLNQSIVITGISTNSSLADYWADESKGYTKDQLASNVPDAYLAWDTWVLDSLPGSNNSYGTVYSNYGDNPPSVYGQTVKRIITNTGYTGEHAISLGGNYSDKFFFGATLGINTVNYESKYEHLESTDVSLPSQFTSFDYTSYYKDSGTGFNIKFGAIYKPIEWLRLGVAFHSPTYYRINEYTYDNISTYFSNGDHYSESNAPYRFSYDLTTPFRVLTGAAVQIGKIALISADYEFVDYSSAKFSDASDGYDYTETNQEITSTLTTANNIRLGAELRIKNLYLRGGYSYYGSAWKNGELNQDQHYNSFSCGLGFRAQNVFADFSFTTLANNENYLMYSSSAGDAQSSLNLIRNMFTLTLGYKFNY